MHTNVREIDTFQGDDGQWYWHAKAGNGEIVVPPEGHTREADARRAAEAVFGGLNDVKVPAYCAGFPVNGDNAQVEVDEDAGTITFGGEAEGMTMAGKPYVTRVTIPLALWSHMVDHPSAAKDDIAGKLGLYVRISIAQSGIERDLTNTEKMPTDGMHREPIEEE